MLLRTFEYSRPILVALRSLSLEPISFGYKTGVPLPHPPHSVVRPPDLELALTPLNDALHNCLTGGQLWPNPDRGSALGKPLGQPRWRTIRRHWFDLFDDVFRTTERASCFRGETPSTTTTRRSSESAFVRRLTFFGHLARMDENADASQAIFEPPPENWRRPPGRPRTTWMKNINDDLSNLRWILGYTRLEIWRKIGLSGD